MPRYTPPVTASLRRLYCAWIAILVVLPVSASAADNSDTQGWVEYQYRTQIRDRLQGSWGLGYRDLISTADGISEWSLEFRYTAQRSRDTVLDEFATTDHVLDLRIRTTLRIRDLGTPW